MLKNTLFLIPFLYTTLVFAQTDSSRAAHTAPDSSKPAAAALPDSGKPATITLVANLDSSKPDSLKPTVLSKDFEYSDSTPARTISDEKLTEWKGQLEGLNESYLETKSIADRLNKIKVSGYVQAQWQLADSAGVPSKAGGDFPFSVANWHDASPPESLRYLDTLASRQRFLVRRARLKTTYDAGTSKYVLEIEVLPAGASIKDANVTLVEPWLKTFSSTFGIMDRPFGFEVPYSSSSLESPERSRIAQTVFPGEKDLGAKLEITPPETMGWLQHFNLKGGLITGMGGNTPSFTEVDKKVDFVGRAGFQIPFYALNMEIDGGFSAYLGTVVNRNDTAYTSKDSLVSTFVMTDQTVQRNSLPDTIITLTDTIKTRGVSLSLGNKDNLFDRTLYGVDAQIYYDIPIIGGASLRGEYLWGKMPGTFVSNSPNYSPAFPLAGLIERKVMGWYLMWVQNIGKTFQGVVKYDVFDPNTDVEGSDIARIFINEINSPPPTHLTTIADLKYSTLGLGFNYYWDENVRLSVYYDIVTNENVNAKNADTLALEYNQISNSPPLPNPLAHYTKDLKDNVFTIRAQVKF